MSKTKHSPLPWEYVEWEVKGRKAQLIADIWTSKCDARFIVTACNSYYNNQQAIAELVEVVEYCLPIVKRWCHTQGDNKVFHEETVAPLKAIIAKHKAKP